MTENEVLYENILRTKNIIENYNFFNAMLSEDIRNEYAINGYNSYKALRDRLEESCPKHIPIILGGFIMSSIYDYKKDEMRPLKEKRCLCCGKIMNYDLDSPYEIDAENYQKELNSSHQDLQAKFSNILDLFMSLAQEFGDFDIAVNELKRTIDNKSKVNIKTEKLLIKK